MGFLKRTEKPTEKELLRLPSGSFTVDAKGKIIVSTLSQSYPKTIVETISRTILECFLDATEAEHPLKEIFVEYAAFSLRAKPLRGGAIVFLTPRPVR